MTNNHLTKRLFFYPFLISGICFLFAISANSQDLALQTAMARPAGIRIAVDSTTVTPVSVDSLIQLAVINSRKLWSLNTNVEIAQHELNASGWFPNPEFRLSDVNTRYFAEDYREMQLGLRLRVPDLGELGEDKQQARVRLWEEKFSEIRYRQELVAKVRRDIADVVLQDKLAELTEKKVQLLDQRIATIEQMIQTGGRSIVYFTKAKMMFAQAKNDDARAIQNQSAARRQLVKRTDIELDTPIEDCELIEVNLSLDELNHLATNLRPETELVDQQIKLAEKRNRLEWMKLFPWVNFVEMSYHREKKLKKDWGEFKMGIELPLFNWNVGNIKAANLAVKKREAKLEAVQETLDEEVRTAYMVYEDLLLDWKTFKQDADVLIKEAAHVVEQAWIYETLRPDEVLEMEMTIIETQQILAEKKHALTYALIDLCYATGAESPEQLSK